MTLCKLFATGANLTVDGSLIAPMKRPLRCPRENRSVSRAGGTLSELWGCSSGARNGKDNLCSFAAKARATTRPLDSLLWLNPELDVQVFHIQRIFFDELATSFDVLTHQRSEDGLALSNVLELHGKQGPALGIHSRLPELWRRHLAQAFVALHVVTAAALFLDVVEKIARIGFLNRLDLNLALRRGLGRFLLLGFLALAFLTFGGTIRWRRLRSRLHDKRWLQVRFNLLELRNHLSALGARSQVPVDDVLGAM